MAKLSKIPPKLQDEVIRLSGEGLSAGKIQDWLKLNHNIQITDRAVQMFLKRISTERKEIAKQAYSKAVAESANQDVTIIGEMISLFRDEVVKSIKDENDAIKGAKIAETLIKFQDRRMKLSGIDKDEDDSDDQALQNLINKVKGK